MPNVIEKTISMIKNMGSATSPEPPKNSSDPIPVGATNLTLGTTLVAAVALIFELLTDWSETLIGEDAGPGPRAALAIALVAAITIVYAADLLARGYASAHALHAAATEGSGRPYETTIGGSIDTTSSNVSIPGLTDGMGSEKDWLIVHVDGDRILAIKTGKPPTWWPISEVRGA